MTRGVDDANADDDDASEDDASEDDADSNEDEDEDASGDDAAEAHACPVHPSRSVREPCSRCGGFYCDACLEAAGRPEDSTRCGACPPEAVVPPTLGGWLTFPALQLVFGIPLMLVRCGQDLQALVDPAIPELGPAVAFELTYTAGYLALACFAANRFFRKRKSAIPTMLGLYVASIVVALFDMGMASHVSDVLGEPHRFDPQLLRGVITPAIWIAYFTNSKRVKETFIVEDP